MIEMFNWWLTISLILAGFSSIVASIYSAYIYFQTREWEVLFFGMMLSMFAYSPLSMFWAIDAAISWWSPNFVIQCLVWIALAFIVGNFFVLLTDHLRH